MYGERQGAKSWWGCSRGYNDGVGIGSRVPVVTISYVPSLDLRHDDLR